MLRPYGHGMRWPIDAGGSRTAPTFIDGIAMIDAGMRCHSVWRFTNCPYGHGMRCYMGVALPWGLIDHSRGMINRRWRATNIHYESRAVAPTSPRPAGTPLRTREGPGVMSPAVRTDIRNRNGS